MVRQNIIGNKYGRLTVIADAPPTKDRRGHKIRMVECVCDCGNHIVCQLNAVKSGHTVSCGCYSKELNSKKFSKENRYEFHDNYVIGYCFNSDTTFLIDLEDYEKVKQYCWLEHKYTGYIVTSVYGERKSGKQLKLHRVIMDAKEGQIVDHINGDKTDNRKSNLRFCNNYQNGMNRTNKTRAKSGHKGVYYIKKDNSWRASISVNGKRIHLGQNRDIEYVIKLREEAEEKYYGEYRRK